ncbi:MAG: hypothetical protein KGJ55_00115 [Gammaproteobacteria bacterium]|nr:hypothetical protein [Gammaproteobacteria bacterium]
MNPEPIHCLLRPVRFQSGDGAFPKASAASERLSTAIIRSAVKASFPPHSLPIATRGSQSCFYGPLSRIVVFSVAATAFSLPLPPEHTAEQRSGRKFYVAAGGDFLPVGQGLGDNRAPSTAADGIIADESS